MKYYYQLLLLVLIGAACAPSQGDDTEHQKVVNELLDQWHKAAATADETVFFDAMHPNAIYYGTDSSEKWTKSEFQEWAAPIFARGKAWDFTPSNRSLYFNEDLTVCWFDEDLVTWMGACRGTGVLSFKEKQWKIEQYHLAVTIPNELIKNYLQLKDTFNTTRPNE